MRRVVLLVLVVALAAGCGASKPRLSRQAYVKRVHAATVAFARSRTAWHELYCRATISARERQREERNRRRAVLAYRDAIRALRPPRELDEAHAAWRDWTDDMVARRRGADDFARALIRFARRGVPPRSLGVDTIATGWTSYPPPKPRGC